MRWLESVLALAPFLAAQTPVFAKSDLPESGYIISATVGGHHAQNIANGISIDFRGNSTLLEAGGTRLSISLSDFGWGGVWQASGPVTSVSTSAHRLERRYSGFREWFQNRPEGLEQGFVFDRREGIGPLRIRLNTSYGWAVETRHEFGTVVFRNGEHAIRYSGLTAYDSRGHMQPSQMWGTSSGLTLEIDDANAVYPLTIDPTWGQQGKITPSDPAAYDVFGYYLSLAGDGKTALVPATGRNGSQGVAFVFAKTGTAWNQEAEFAPTDLSPDDTFGAANALSADGNTALLSTPFQNGGAVYVFTRTSGIWTQQAKLNAADTDPLNTFGDSVALSADGNTAVIGGGRYIGNGASYTSRSAAVYIFTRTGTVWSQQMELFPSGNNIATVTSVAISSDGSTALIATDGLLGGAISIYTLTSNTWSQQFASQLGSFGNVGLSADGNTAMANTWTKLLGSRLDIFTRNNGAWSLQAKLMPSDQVDLAGSAALSADGNTMLFGLPNMLDSCHSRTGFAYFYTRSGGIWSKVAEVNANDESSDSFGQAVALSNDGAVALIGAPEKLGSIAGQASAGAAYIFAVPTGNPVNVPVNVTLTTLPPGLPLLVGGVSTATPVTSSQISGNTLSFEAPSIEPAGIGSRYTFQRWSNCGSAGQIVTTPQTDITYTAQYVLQNQLRLTATPTGGGSAASSPVAADGYYNATDSVSIQAYPANGYLFSGFSGDVNSTASPAVVPMSAPRAVTANFVKAQAPSVTIVLANDVSRAAQPGPDVVASLIFHNSGGSASAVSIIYLSAQVISPSNISATVTSAVPISVGAIPANSSSGAISIRMNIPAQAVRTSVSGLAQYTGGSFAFSFTVIRPASGAPGPSISSVSPNPSLRLRTVKISGVNFDTNCNNDSIAVGGVTIHPVTPCSTTTLNFVVPSTAAFGTSALRLTTPLGAAAGPFEVLPTRVVVAAGPNPATGQAASNDRFAVIDYSNPDTPSVVVMSPMFASGATVVDCSGRLLAAADALGGLVSIYDLSTPATPVKLASLNTGFGSIGAIKFDGARVLVGDYFGSSVALIDVSTPASPSILSTIHQIFSIGSLGMSGTTAVASGNNATLAIVDFSQPTQPSWSTFLPKLGSALTVDMDGNIAAAGALDRPLVFLVDLPNRAVVAQADPQICAFTQPPQCVGSPKECASPTCVNSLSIKNRVVAAASDIHRDIAIIDFSNSNNPIVSTFNPQLGVAAPVVTFDGQYLAAGGINSAAGSSFVNLFLVSGTAASMVGGVNSGLVSVGTIGMCTF